MNDQIAGMITGLNLAYVALVMNLHEATSINASVLANGLRYSALSVADDNAVAILRELADGIDRCLEAERGKPGPRPAT